MARTKQAARRKNGKRKSSDNQGRQDIAKQPQLSRKSAKAEKRAKRAREEEPSLADTTNTTVENSKNDSAILNPDDASTQPRPSKSSNLNTSSTTSSNITIDPSLAKSHDVTTMSVLSSTQMQQRVTRTLSLLSTYPTTPPVVVMLHAKAVAASKMISIAEIVKREIAGAGGKWFQYSSVDKSMEEQKGKANKNSEEGDQEMGGIDEEEEEDAFEVMKTPFERTIEGTVKVRAVPIMMIYLSRVRVESLRREYGEQTNATGLPQ